MGGIISRLLIFCALDEGVKQGVFRGGRPGRGGWTPLFYSVIRMHERGRELLRLLLLLLLLYI